MLERNRFHGESNKTLPPPGLWVQRADTSPLKYFASLSICHSYTVTPMTVTWALPGPGPVHGAWRPRAGSGRGSSVSPRGPAPCLSGAGPRAGSRVDICPAALSLHTFSCSGKSPCACRVLSSQEKSLTDAHGKGVSGVLQEAMS